MLCGVVVMILLFCVCMVTVSDGGKGVIKSTAINLPGATESNAVISCCNIYKQLLSEVMHWHRVRCHQDAGSVCYQDSVLGS